MSEYNEGKVFIHNGEWTYKMFPDMVWIFTEGSGQASRTNPIIYTHRYVEGMKNDKGWEELWEIVEKGYGLTIDTN